MRGVAIANAATENGVKLFLSSLGTDFQIRKPGIGS